MKSCTSLAVVSVVASLVVAAAADAATYNYFDTTWNNADWIGTKYADTSSPTGSFSATHAFSGGSALLPGPQTPDYRAIVHSFGGPGAGAINVTHQGVNFNFAPLPAEVVGTVAYTYDLQFFSTVNFGAVGFAPAIFQGGSVYRTAYDNVFSPTTGWVRFSGAGLPLSAFTKMDPTTAGLSAGSPNGALPMSFGFVSANSANQPSVVKESGIDDFGITLNTRIVPEPTSMAALAAATLAAGRRRRPTTR